MVFMVKFSTKILNFQNVIIIVGSNLKTLSFAHPPSHSRSSITLMKQHYPFLFCCETVKINQTLLHF
jgi:hypothetical protein